MLVFGIQVFFGFSRTDGLVINEMIGQFAEFGKQLGKVFVQGLGMFRGTQIGISIIFGETKGTRKSGWTQWKGCRSFVTRFVLHGNFKSTDGCGSGCRRIFFIGRVPLLHAIQARAPQQLMKVPNGRYQCLGFRRGWKGRRFGQLTPGIPTTREHVQALGKELCDAIGDVVLGTTFDGTGAWTTVSGRRINGGGWRRLGGMNQGKIRVVVVTARGGFVGHDCCVHA